jgi:lipid A 3-O-deacylase
MFAVAVLATPYDVMAQPIHEPNLNDTNQVETGGPTTAHGVGMRLGYHQDYRNAALTYETPSLWSHESQSGWGRVELSVELGLAYWKAIRGESESMGQIAAIPILRWWPSQRFYLEIGSGPTMLSRSEFSGYDLSTRFQFASHFGAGMLINKRHRLGVNYSHHSNASIKKPNPGLNMLELAYTYRF